MCCIFYADHLIKKQSQGCYCGLSFAVWYSQLLLIRLWSLVGCSLIMSMFDAFALHYHSSMFFHHVIGAVTVIECAHLDLFLNVALILMFRLHVHALVGCIYTG